MAVKQILFHRETQCELCNRDAVLVVGDYESWYAITKQPFSEYAKEQFADGVNILHDRGCQACNPLR